MRERVEEVMCAEGKPYTASELTAVLQAPIARVYKAIAQLKSEGLITQESKHSGRSPATFRWKGAA